MRSLRRLLITLAMLAGALSFYSAPAFAAPSTTVEITDVYNAVNPAEEWFQLYNMTKSAVTLTGWKVCNNSACLTLPATTIEPFSLSKIKSASVSGWPAGGLNGAIDMVGVLDDKGVAVDAVNWGVPNASWANYSLFQAMLWNPGVKAPDANGNQAFFRLAIGNDTDQVSDWLTTSTKVAADATPVASPTTAPVATTAPAAATATGVAPLAPTATAGSAAPQATSTPAPSGSTTGGTGAPTGGTAAGTTNTGSTTPQTGGEFPILLTIGLIALLMVIRYARRSVTAHSTRN